MSKSASDITIDEFIKKNGTSSFSILILELIRRMPFDPANNDLIGEVMEMNRQLASALKNFGK